MKVEHYILGPVQTNCYIAINDQTKEAVVIDPGDSGKALADRVKANGYRPVAILLTHGHFDHAGGVENFKSCFDEKIPVYAHEAEKETLANPALNLSSGMGWDPEVYHADIFVKDEEELELAGMKIRVLFTPGHTDGGCCFYFPKEAALFSGDTLFCQSVGRTDFPHGSMAKLLQAVKEKLFVLPDETHVYPGHEGDTTIGFEKENNFFVH